MNVISRFYPEKLTTRIMLLAIILVCLSTITIAYLVEKQGRDMLLQEKEQKLFAVAHSLDFVLEAHFNQLDSTLSRDEQIAKLNTILSPKVEAILKYTPQIGAGYYNKVLDAIIVYVPKAQYQDTVGQAISLEHPGRKVMRTQANLIYEGHQVRGNILNAMVPIIRNSEVLGYIWSNELVDDINAQTLKLDLNIVTVCVIGLICSILLTLLLSRKLNRDIDIIKLGLHRLSLNQSSRLPPIRGEMNEIVRGVNQLSSELIEARSINEMILDSTNDGIIAIDNHALITTLNPAAEKIIGYKKKTLLGWHYNSIFDDKNHKSPLLDTLYNGIDHIGVEVDFPVAGRVLQISASTSHLKDRYGNFSGAVIVFKDLTNQKEMQRVMQETERLVAIGELMAGVAHEVRNPLAAIRGFVQYLSKDIKNEESLKYIDIILNEVDMINDVIQQLLDFSKPYTNCYSDTSLNQLIQDTLILLKSSKHSLVTFTLHLDDSLPHIYVDRSMIKQVLLNLLINSIQAIAENEGEISITTRFSDNKRMQLIEIHDSGEGMKEDDKENIFTPFFTTKPSGTGLGLAIVKKIVNSHNGTVQIFNHKQGGVMAIISLPMQHNNK